MEEVLRLYRDELPLSTQSAFATHGLSTFIVLLSGWLAFCAAIDGVASVVDCKKLQPDAATNNPKLRALARRTVARQWAFVLAQAVIFAPLLKAAFPLHPLQTALSPSEYASFFIIWLVKRRLPPSLPSLPSLPPLLSSHSS